MDAVDGESEKEPREFDCRMASLHVAEIHWYEAARIGRKEFKVKRLLKD
jgi:hypothetical protein